MSTMRQQIHPNSTKNIFRKQKSIDSNDKPASEGKKALRKQLSVDHVTSSLKQVSSSASAPVTFSSFLWRNSTQSLNESNSRIAPSSVVKKRAQFANSLNTSALSKWVIAKLGIPLKVQSFIAFEANKLSLRGRCRNTSYYMRDNVCSTFASFFSSPDALILLIRFYADFRFSLFLHS